MNAQRSDAFRSPTAPRANGILRWSIALSLAVPLALFVAFAVVTHVKAIDAARLRLDRTATIAREHAMRVMETNFVIAREVRRTLEDLPDAGRAPDSGLLHRRVSELVTGLAQVQSIWIWDARGRPLASNRFHPPPRGLNIADRDYFRWARDGTGDWFISAPLVSRMTGEAFIDVTTRWSRDGRFAGAISVSLYPTHFTRFYQGLAETESGLSVALLKRDGTVIARWPELAEHGTRLAADSPLRLAMEGGLEGGRTRGRSSLDQLEREVSFLRVGASDVYVAATADRSRLLANWSRETLAFGLLALAAALVMASLARLALKRTERLAAESEQRVKAEENLRHAQKLEALGRLTGGVAHDFNNLLMVINTNAYLLRRHADGVASPQLAAILRAVEAGSRLTRQLLAFSRRQALRPITLNLGAHLPPLADLLRASTGSSVTIDIAVDPATRPINVDPAEFELALLNLAINARDAMPQGGRLDIHAANAATPGEVDITVRDTGSGIAPELLDKVFEPFFTTKPHGMGTGLGLSQVHGFCVQAGGAVHIASTPGAGTTITLRLPAAADDGVTAAHDVAPPATALSGHVLLAEDNEDVARATVDILGELGLTVDHVGSGDAALEALGHGRYAAVVSDIMMPGATDGIALADWLRRERPDCAVVLMSGYSEQMQLAQRSGHTVLQKPCAPEALAGALRVALARRHPSA